MPKQPPLEQEAAGEEFQETEKMRASKLRSQQTSLGIGVPVEGPGTETGILTLEKHSERRLQQSLPPKTAAGHGVRELKNKWHIQKLEVNTGEFTRNEEGITFIPFNTWTVNVAIR